MLKVILCIFCSMRLYAYDFEISIATIFRDEAPFLKEWIEFHKLIGVEHFYLYNHNSHDNFEEVLRPYIKEGVVELINWTEEPESRNQWLLVQQKMLLDAVIRTQDISKWVAFIDVDEFIFPVEDKTLSKFLPRYENYGAVAIYWQLFGTSHIDHLRTDQLMIEQLVFRAERNHELNGWYKPIVQVKHVNTSNLVGGPHEFVLKNGYTTVGLNGKPAKLFSIAGVDQIRIHHYNTRDEHFLHQVKLKRPNMDQDKKNFTQKIADASNEIEDRSILVYAEDLRKAVFPVYRFSLYNIFDTTE